MVEFPVFTVMGNHPKEAALCDTDACYDWSNDMIPMPFPMVAYGDPVNAYAEGYLTINDGGDRHINMIDVENWFDYGTYGTYRKITNEGVMRWRITSCVKFDYNVETFPFVSRDYIVSNVNGTALRDTVASYRRLEWSSTDAAGLDLAAGVIYLHEIEEGEIQHAMRTTVMSSWATFTYPASHQAGHATDNRAAPMGLRFRLKPSYDINAHVPLTATPGTDLYKSQRAARIILRALKKYGMINADNAGPGFNSYLMAERDDHTELKWSNLWGTTYMSNAVPMDASIMYNFYGCTTSGLNSGITWDDFEVVDWKWQYHQYSNYKSRQ
jgi:hypothetical protein